MREISIVIPVKNEAGNVEALIRSIGRMTALPREVIFVDGGSSDGTVKVIERSSDKYDFKIRVILGEGAYPGEGRNIGVRHAEYDMIAFTDAGIRLDPGWLEELSECMRSGGFDVVYGAYDPVLDTFARRCAVIAFIPSRDNVGGRSFRTDFIASSLFKRTVIEKAGWFPPFRAAEDKIFMENVKKTGVKIGYTEKAVVHWETPATFSGVFRRFYTFSFHDLKAGRARDWHLSVFRTYLAMAAFAAAGVVISPLCLWGIAVIWLSRMLKLYFKKKQDLRAYHILDPRYLAGVPLMVLLTDIAMFAGAVRFAVSKYENKK